MSVADRLGYQTDVTDEEWAFVAPYLTLCREDAAQREYAGRKPQPTAKILDSRTLQSTP